MFWFGKQKRQVLERLKFLEGFARGSNIRANQARDARAKIRKRIFELQKSHAGMREDLENLLEKNKQ